MSAAPQKFRRQGRAGITKRGVIDWLDLALEEDQLQGAEDARRTDRPQHMHAFVERTNPSLLAFEHIPQLVDVAERIVTGVHQHVIVMMPPRYMKALADDTPIATPAGWTRIADLRPGDLVFAPDGSPTRVLGVQHHGEKPVYRVSTDDGQSVLAAHDHRWLVRLDRKRPRWKVHTTEQLARRTSPRRPLIPTFAALELPDAALPIPPYTLGQWLGDGSTHYAAITTSVRDQAWVREQIEADGFRTRLHPSGKGIMYGVLGLSRLLRTSGLFGNKHVPRVYFRASVSQRIALLQGLVDSDGTVSHVNHGQVTFTTTSWRLKEDMLELVHGLGVKASVHERRAMLNGQDCGPSYHVMFHAKFAARLPRKAKWCRNGTRTPGRFLSFEAAGTAPVTCIAVEHPSQLFLAGRGLIVTHNTEVFGRLLPAHFLHRHPTWSAGLASYGADLAWATSEEARNYFQADGGKLVRDTSAKKRWAVVGGGEMWATGVGGPMLGFGYHLGMIDDPQDPEKAHSPTFQKKFEDWFASKFLSRRNIGAARIVVVMQRLGIGDAIDYLFRREVGEDTDVAPMNWHVVAMEEVRTTGQLGRWDGPRGLPPTCTLEPDRRSVGMVLAPSRFDLGTVKHMQLTAGPYVNAAQRQQAPMAPQGDFWKEEWFQDYEELPAGAYNGGTDADLAYGKDDHGSASALIRTFRGPGKDAEFPIYIDAVEWDWLEFPEAVAMVRSFPGPHYIEAKASGKSVAQVLRRQGLPVIEVQVKGGKFTRATGVQPVVAQGRIFVRRSIKRRLLHGERQGLLRVTAEALVADKGDLDLNDVFVQAVMRHVRRGSNNRGRGGRRPSGSVTTMR